MRQPSRIVLSPADWLARAGLSLLGQRQYGASGSELEMGLSAGSGRKLHPSHCVVGDVKYSYCHMRDATKCSE